MLLISGGKEVSFAARTRVGSECLPTQAIRCDTNSPLVLDGFIRTSSHSQVTREAGDDGIRLKMCKTALSSLLRLFSLVVAGFGIGLIIYSIFFAVKASSFGAPSGVSLGLGLVDAVMGLLLATCAYNKRFFLKLFLLVNGLLLIGEAVIAILFAIPSQQDTIISRMDLEADVLTWVRDHIQVTTYVFVAVIAAKAVAAGLVCLQLLALREKFDEKAAGASAGKERLLGNGATVDPEAATNRYRDGHAAMYEKYGIR